MRCLVLAPLITVLSGLVPSISLAQELTKNVYDGVGYCVGTDIRDVERCALEDAKRDALDKAGTIIQASSKVSMYQLTENEINSFAAGLVKVLEKNINTQYDSVLKVLKTRAVIKAEIDNRTVLEGIESFTSADSSLKELRAKKQDTGGKLQFEFSLIGRKKAPDGSLEEVPIGDDSPLNAGDLFQIKFKASRDSYVYVINIDSRGRVFPAFPNNEKGILDNHLAAGEQYTLPAPGLYYQLDDNPGPETLYFIGSLEPMRDISFIVENISQSGGKGDDSQALRGLLDTRSTARGISRITESSDSDGILADKAGKILEGYGSLVRKTIFRHR